MNIFFDAKKFSLWLNAMTETKQKKNNKID